MEAKKLWGGRFEASLEEWVEEFGASIRFDQKLAKYDIQGSLAHVQMLGATGVISLEEAQSIQAGLEELLNDYETGKLVFDIRNEDIHMNIESLLTEKIGSVAGKLHTARSRNDQVATDMHLYLKDTLFQVVDKLTNLRQTLVNLAQEHIETVMPGYTHLQHAQPISFAQHMLAYYNMFSRDSERFAFNIQHTDISPLGAAALAGTTFPIDRQLTSDLMGFAHPYTNSLDAVSDRDFILEFLSNASILMMHMSRLCEEIINWCSHEYKFVTLSDTFSTGSSIMPQKKNPDVPELVRGKSGRVFGDLISLLTLMKGQPLAYNKDNQEDKEPLFDAIDTVRGCLMAFADMVPALVPNIEIMREAALRGFSTATDLADYLVKKGVAFRDAHEIVGKAVALGVAEEKDLSELTLEQLQQFSDLIEADVFDKALTLEASVNARDHIGGTSPKQVEAAITRAHTRLEQLYA
jgi:argininosuccinate lyase